MQFVIETCVYYSCCIGDLQCFENACWRFIVAGLPWNSIFLNLYTGYGLEEGKYWQPTFLGLLYYIMRAMPVYENQFRPDGCLFAIHTLRLYYIIIIRCNTWNNIHSVHVLTLWCLNFDGVARTRVPCVYTIMHIIIVNR